MKKVPNIYYAAPILLILLLLKPFDARAQRTVTTPKGHVMQYVIEGRDTIFIDEIMPSVIHPRQTMSKREWTRYYKRVYNFSRAYPYALLVSKVIKDTDSLFVTDKMSKRKQERYLNKMKDDLIKEFDPIFRNLSLKQGLMMIRLIDREAGMTPYYIIRHFYSGATAGFWQGVARLFKGDLKRSYDRFGEDRDLEELVGYWERGEFEELYFEIFGQAPKPIYVPERFREEAASLQSPKR
ncbi:MAG: DUF4294 domain-containing protein [Bacteroidales bacterium]|nr:DUF4294 domain-containing protein [Bacteroidales bacterium]